MIDLMVHLIGFSIHTICGEVSRKHLRVDEIIQEFLGAANENLVISELVQLFSAGIFSHLRCPQIAALDLS
jgi:hypothetical protein